jgi:hypothetical protein
MTCFSLLPIWVVPSVSSLFFFAMYDFISF